MKIEELILEKIFEEKYSSFKISDKDEFQCVWRDCDGKMVIVWNYDSNSLYVHLQDFKTQSLRCPILMKLRKKQTRIKVEDFIEAHSED